MTYSDPGSPDSVQILSGSARGLLVLSLVGILPLLPGLPGPLGLADLQAGQVSVIPPMAIVIPPRPLPPLPPPVALPPVVPVIPVPVTVPVTVPPSAPMVASPLVSPAPTPGPTPVPALPMDSTNALLAESPVPFPGSTLPVPMQQFRIAGMTTSGLQEAQLLLQQARGQSLFSAADLQVLERLQREIQMALAERLPGKPD